MNATTARVLATILLCAIAAESPAGPPGMARESAAAGEFVHPGLLNIEPDFVRIRAKLASRQQPWTDGWRALLESRHAQLGWKQRPYKRIVRGGSGQNFPVLFNDIHAAYQMALRWKLTGEVAYADKAVEILNAWSSTLRSLTGNADRFLAAGVYGYQLANAAEVMRTYEGWRSKDRERLQEMMLTVFYPMNHDFLVRHNDAAITNYWANWDLCNIASVMAIGVLCDRRDLYDEAIDYLHHGQGNGAMDKVVYYVHPGRLGQWQESGRDQGHSTLGISLMAAICEMAWNQGDDLYGYGNNRFLAGAEYVAKYNLGKDVPFQPYAWGTGPRGDHREQTIVSALGRGSRRAGYELVVNHYVNRKGIAAPYSTRYAAKLRPERGGGGHASTFDQLGFGTLTESIEPQIAEPAPSGLTARNHGGDVVLSWWGASGVTSYDVKRATDRAEVQTIASSVHGLLTYTDRNPKPGQYRYTVVGVRDGKPTRHSNIVSIDTNPRLLAHLEFGGLASDDVHNKVTDAPMGKLLGGAKLADGPASNAVSLDGKDDFVSLSEGLVSELSDFTIATWVYLNQDQTWARVFDFGGNQGQYLYLTPHGESGTARFAVATVWNYNEQGVDAPTALPTNRWVHVAVTLRGRLATLFVDGKSVGSNPGIDFPPFRLGSTPRNWIGRSQFQADPYLDGKVDNFRIYNGALSTEQIASLARRDREG